MLHVDRSSESAASVSRRSRAVRPSQAGVAFCSCTSDSRLPFSLRCCVPVLICCSLCALMCQKLSARDIPAIEEVNLFHKDGHVIHFVSDNKKSKATSAQRFRPRVTEASADNRFCVM